MMTVRREELGWAREGDGQGGKGKARERREITVYHNATKLSSGAIKISFRDNCFTKAHGRRQIMNTVNISLLHGRPLG